MLNTINLEIQAENIKNNLWILLVASQSLVSYTLGRVISKDSFIITVLLLLCKLLLSPNTFFKKTLIINSYK